MRQIRFRFDGQPINETDTPAQVSLKLCNSDFSFMEQFTEQRYRGLQGGCGPENLSFKSIVIVCTCTQCVWLKYCK